MEKILIITIIGYITGLIGFLGGVFFSAATHRFGSKFHGTLLGFTGGLLIAFICFEMLPPAFENHSVGLGIIGIILGVAVSTILENKIEKFTYISDSGKRNAYLKSGMLLALGIMIHKLPEGMAMGSLLNINPVAGLSMSVIICMHCFPEAVAVAIPLKKGGMGYGKLILGCFIVSLPMAFGSLLGAVLADISSMFVALCLSFASGVMIYITCGEIIPESKEVWHGSLSTVGAAIGFVIGVFFIYSV